MKLSIRGLLPPGGGSHAREPIRLFHLCRHRRAPRTFEGYPWLKLATVSGIRGTSVLLCSVQGSHVDLELLGGMNLRPRSIPLVISNRQLDQMPPWTWESLVSFKQQFGETRGILQFFGTVFKRTKGAEKGKSKNSYSANILCSYHVLRSGKCP